MSENRKDDIHPALEHLMSGRYQLAQSTYTTKQEEERNGPDTGSLALEALCATAASGNIDEASAVMSQVKLDSLSPAEKARYRTAEAYLQVKKGDSDKVVDLLKDAVQLDPSFPLSHLSLGRQLLLGERKEKESREYFERAAELAPSSNGPLLGLVTLEAETGNYRSAGQVARQLTRADPLDLRAWLSWGAAKLLGSPLGGRLPILAIVVMSLIPYIGPLVGVVWLLYSILSFLSLRRISPRLALYPPVSFFVFLSAYIARSIIYGAFFP